MQVGRGAAIRDSRGKVLNVVCRRQQDDQVWMCGADPPGGFDATHSWHMNVHQHDPSTTVRDEFDCGFASFAIAAHREILRGSNSGSCREPKTGLVIDNPDPHPFVRHLRMMRHDFVPHDGVHTTIFHTEPLSPRNISTALTRRSTESSTVKPSLAKMELMCFSTAR